MLFVPFVLRDEVGLPKVVVEQAVRDWFDIYGIVLAHKMKARIFSNSHVQSVDGVLV